jgi:membrane dipeptidase
MLVDISHVSPKTFWDVMETTTKPVIASHSSAWALCQHPRNMNDDQLKAVAKNGGVVCASFVPQFLSETYRQQYSSLEEREKEELKALEERLKDRPEELEKAQKQLTARNEDVARNELELPDYTVIVDHIEHMIKVAGIDHVGLGSDFDGVKAVPRGMEDCTKLPWLTEELVRRGYADGEIKKVLGENVLRLMEEVIGR